MSLIGALTSSIRGGRYVHSESNGQRDDVVLVETEGSGALPHVEDVHVGQAATGGHR
jgi:hypothetical protein